MKTILNKGSDVKIWALLAIVTCALGFFVLTGCGSSNGTAAVTGLPGSAATQAQVQAGRALVLNHSCTDCNNRGNDDPSSANWMAGYLPGTPGQPFLIGPFKTYPANLTPDVATGIGGHTDRQIYNALKFGLDPGTTPDVVITSTTPGQNNFPATPHYLAPPMPWPAWRHETDANLWAIVAYLKHGIKSVPNTVPPSQGPPDFWAGAYSPNIIGPADIPAYPTASEQFTP